MFIYIYIGHIPKGYCPGITKDFCRHDLSPAGDNCIAADRQVAEILQSPLPCQDQWTGTESGR